jgi:hypothetical protein
MGYLKIVTNFLLGFLIGLTVFLFGLKIVSSIWGTIIGLAINITVAAYILKQQRKNKTLKVLAYGIVTASVILIVAYFALSTMIMALFSGVAA